MLINDILKDACALIPNSVYLRATSTEANTSVADIDLAGKTFCLYNNLSSVVYNVGNSVVSSHPVEIKFLELADFDDDTEQGDVIRERLLEVAKSIFFTISIDDRVSKAEITESFEINMEDNVKLYDTIMTGVSLEFDIFIDGSQLCPL
tara:strand:+ start:4659 stop:5105 length:447 start_codon:yes stop_codon:yes gene_type:complete